MIRLHELVQLQDLTPKRKKLGILAAGTVAIGIPIQYQPIASQNDAGSGVSTTEGDISLFSRNRVLPYAYTIAVDSNQQKVEKCSLHLYNTSQ